MNMRLRLVSGVLLLAGALATGNSTVSVAAPITITTVSGSGSYNNNPYLLVNGYLPAEGTFWKDSANVWWEGTTPAFTFDFNAVYLVDDMQIQVDNNDNYLIQYSINGSLWNNLYTIPSGAGTISGGMDTFTTSEISFTPVYARYLRMSAVSGDTMYSISEVQAFGTGPVPEPASLMLVGSGMVAVLGIRKKRQNS
jgi:hypothetical protein